MTSLGSYSREGVIFSMLVSRGGDNREEELFRKYGNVCLSQTSSLSNGVVKNCVFLRRSSDLDLVRLVHRQYQLKIK